MKNVLAGARPARLLNAEGLERSEVVANVCMNRERNLLGLNSYEKELGFSPAEFLSGILEKKDHASWLDLCCGAGRALVQAAELLNARGFGDRVNLLGLDLIPLFDPIPLHQTHIHLTSSSVERWSASERFDLITCVHGLHYVGDKLGLLTRAAGWLKADGRLLAHLDFQNLRVHGLKRPAVQFGKDLRDAGFEYKSGRKLIMRSGDGPPRSLPYRYLGADDKAGPNYAGQAAANSYYERIPK